MRFFIRPKKSNKHIKNQLDEEANNIEKMRQLNQRDTKKCAHV